MGDYVLSWADFAFMIFFGLLLPILVVAQGKPEFAVSNLTTEQKKSLYISNGLMMWAGAFLVFMIWLFNSRSFVKFGFDWPRYHIYALIASAVLIGTYLVDLIYETKSKKRKEKNIAKWKENTPFLPVNLNEYKYFSFAAFTAGFCEEVIFRGFMVNFILAMTGGHWSAFAMSIFLPAIIFGALHIYQGHVAVNKIILGGILFGLIYFYTQSLLVVILIHFGIDMLAAYVYMKVYKQENSKSKILATEQSIEISGQSSEKNTL